MNNSHILIQYTRDAMMLVLILSAPVIVVASVVGLVVSLFQALTQLQDQTASFAAKLVAVIIALILTGSWVGSEILQFSTRLFDFFPFIAK